MKLDWDWIGGLLVGVAIVALLFSLGAALFGQADKNRAKVEHMTTACIEAGFSGWNTTVGCFGGRK